MMKFPAYFVLLATLVAHVLLPALNATGVENSEGKRIAVCTTLGIQIIDLGEPQSVDTIEANSSFQCPCIHFSHPPQSLVLLLPQKINSVYLPVVAPVAALPFKQGYSSRAPPTV